MILTLVLLILVPVNDAGGILTHGSSTFRTLLILEV